VISFLIWFFVVGAFVFFYLYEFFFFIILVEMGELDFIVVCCWLLFL